MQLQQNGVQTENFGKKFTTAALEKTINIAAIITSSSLKLLLSIFA